MVLVAFAPVCLSLNPASRTSKGARGGWFSPVLKHILLPWQLLQTVITWFFFPPSFWSMAIIWAGLMPNRFFSWAWVWGRLFYRTLEIGLIQSQMELLNMYWGSIINSSGPASIVIVRRQIHQNIMMSLSSFIMLFGFNYNRSHPRFNSCLGITPCSFPFCQHDSLHCIFKMILVKE